MTEPLGDLIAHARDTRVAVVGGGVSGLVAAYECAKVGMAVRVLEGSERLGGVVHAVELDGVTLDAGAESYATRGGGVGALLNELGLGDAVVPPGAAGAWVAGIPGVGAAPLPPGGVLGIPANPWDPAVRRVIGWPGAWRAYLDRLRPPMTIGREKSLGRLVRTRMGSAVHDRLVAPVTSGVYSARPDEIDVDLAAPGLSGALTRTGSLAGAVGDLRGDRGTVPGSAVAGIDGGMWRLVDALRVALEELGVEITTSARVDALTPGDTTAWRLLLSPTQTGTGATEEGGEAVDADLVIVATHEEAARALLAPVVPALGAQAVPSPEVEVVTLVLDAPALDAAPRGNGVLTVPGAFAAKALTHSTAKWRWVARAFEGRHVVRVSFGTQGEAPATAYLDDAEAARLAVGEASALLGVPLDEAQVVAAHRARFAQSQPAATLGRPATVAAARGAVRAVPGLAVVGAWLSGTGLAQVIPDAANETDRLRRTALWGEEVNPS